ncbi:MAG: hypothetical protein VKI82_15210 [Leptolyngbya sp.]|nr:hypothetical protein [Leptolyngbya sp.]
MSMPSVFTPAKVTVVEGRNASLRGCRRWVGLGLMLGLMLASCRPASGPQVNAPNGNAPNGNAPNGNPSAPPAPPTAEPAPPTAPAPAPTGEPPAPQAPVSQAPTTTPPVQSDPLPDALVNQWEPMSNVLLAFGPMTITSGDITWGSGQASPYTLISTEDGFLLKLEANPQFYDTHHPYVKLIPKTDESGAITTVEVAFYEGEPQAQRDEYMMYGTYFVN